MDIQVLQYFLTVVQEENITKAAERLHMTQPPLSRQLKDLEEELEKSCSYGEIKRLRSQKAICFCKNVLTLWKNHGRINLFQ